jgi:hypothetical protein
MFDTKALAEATAAVVRAHIHETVTPLLKRIEELEAREPEPLPDIDAKIVQAMEGVISSDDVKAICEQLIGAIPEPVNGKDGIDGKDGKDGTNGIDGKNGTDGIHGKDGLDGKNGRDGLDAVEFIRSEGNLIVTLSNGTTKDLGPINGKDGAPGKDGMGFDDLDVTYDGERTFKLKFARPGDVKEFEFSIPVAIYRGVFKEGDSYKQGDTVTWGGHLYHCDTDTTDKPDGEQRCWTLAVRRGRDGKDTKPVKV